ncbi:MAG: tetratricopeptide repeat protein [Candidatus Promineifilaceae bacterium]
MSKQKRAKAPSRSSNAPLDRLTAWFEQPGHEADIIILIFLAVLAFVVFANVLNGEFVYDDTRQILQNPVVRNSDRLWTAFTTDVWAFKSGGTEAISDYWRPIFVLWLVINERLFGLENTAGWHLTNVLLHVATAVMAFGLLRQLKFGRPIATAIILIFILHPVHVETVSWISGSPDLLMALPILGACSLLLIHQKTADLKPYLAALLLFAIALLAKEAAILFPLLVFLIYLLWADRKKVGVKGILYAVRLTLPFLLIAVLYLAARVTVLGHLFTERPWQQPFQNILLTLPSVVAFYLRQTIFPLQLGPSYPLRIVNPDSIGFQNFWLPILVTIISLAILIWLVRRDRVKQWGLALFFLFLLPSFNINAFYPEHIVHDRYLYLPLLGFLIIFLPTLESVVRKLAARFPKPNEKPLSSGTLTLLVTAVFCVPLVFQTIRYNTAWKSDLALWEWGVQTDPTSILNTYQYGYYLHRNGRLDAAETAMNKVIEEQPLSGPYYTYLYAIEAHLERADITASQGRTEEAREDLALVIELSPLNISQEGRANLDAQQQRAFERLALSYVRTEDSVSAVATLENARRQLPQLACTFTTNLAVTLYLSGQKERALTELENIQDRVELEYTPLCKMSLFYLGQLYLEFGQTEQARAIFMQFLTVSDTFYDAQTINLREQTTQLLDRISDQ